MIPVTRLYDSEAAVRSAFDHLAEAELPRESIMVISPGDQTAAQAVDAAIDNGRLRSGHRRALKAALERGRWIVSVKPDFLLSGAAQDALEAAGPVDTHTIPSYASNNPAPFSDMLGIPVLTDGQTDTELFKFDLESSFGFKLLSNNRTPLSSLFGLPLLKSSKRARGSSVERMSGTAAPFSSRFGLKLLSTGGGSKARGSSVERLSGKAAPFSNLLGLRVLSKKR